VELVATLDNFKMSMPPVPENVKEEVVSWDWRGNRKTREHVLPESEDGISKLKIDEIVDETSPL